MLDWDEIRHASRKYQTGFLSTCKYISPIYHHTRSTTWLDCRHFHDHFRAFRFGILIIISRFWQHKFLWAIDSQFFAHFGPDPCILNYVFDAWLAHSRSCIREGQGIGWGLMRHKLGEFGLFLSSVLIVSRLSILFNKVRHVPKWVHFLLLRQLLGLSY